MTDQLSIEIWPTATTKNLGHIKLNAPKSLNALNLPMAALMFKQLSEWQTDDSIAAVFIDGSGEKAFCAGGDVVAMYNAMKQNQGQIPEFLQDFFLTEYRLDYLIHTYQKPIVLWGNGIVMGGGLGLMAGASHRVVTETSRIAMPEITIGLYPDVGGSYFLNKMPDGCGLFLGLTGASINATDALFTGLADYIINSDQKELLVNSLCALNWSDSSDENHQLAKQILRHYQLQEPTESNLHRYSDQINDLAKIDDLQQIISHILAIDGDDKWLTKAQMSLKHGSPITAHLVQQQLKRSKQLSLADVFRMEAIMSLRCGEFGEFQEGVRALLIDKDGQPNWRYKSVNEVPKDAIELFFTSPWQRHPLADLGE